MDDFEEMLRQNVDPQIEQVNELQAKLRAHREASEQNQRKAQETKSRMESIAMRVREKITGDRFPKLKARYYANTKVVESSDDGIRGGMIISGGLSVGIIEVIMRPRDSGLDVEVSSHVNDERGNRSINGFKSAVNLDAEGMTDEAVIEVVDKLLVSCAQATLKFFKKL